MFPKRTSSSEGWPEVLPHWTLGQMSQTWYLGICERAYDSPEEPLTEVMRCCLLVKPFHRHWKVTIERLIQFHDINPIRGPSVWWMAHRILNARKCSRKKRRNTPDADGAIFHWTRRKKRREQMEAGPICVVTLRRLLLSLQCVQDCCSNRIWSLFAWLLASRPVWMGP